MGELAIAAMHRLIKKAGAERVSESAAREMGKVLEDIGLKIGKEAIEWSMHAGRKTVKAEDVRKAAEKILGR
ncbi:histone [Candidatus Bathyarchaeota archaeon]|nr:MAG: histone [Candidatus Bathyarchaeota archaeon]RLI11091.1 MAG: histone [Candidatus Bathyarchaeota archaeon]